MFNKFDIVQVHLRWLLSESKILHNNNLPDGVNELHKDFRLTQYRDFVPSYNCSATFSNDFVKRRQRKEKVRKNHFKGKIEFM